MAYAPAITQYSQKESNLSIERYTDFSDLGTHRCIFKILKKKHNSVRPV